MFEARPHQEVELIFAATHPRSLNASEPGCGKTFSMAKLAEWYVTERNSKVIVCQPNSLRRKNRQELLKFTELTENDIEILDKSHETLGKRKRASSNRCDPDTGYLDYIATSEAKVFVVGYTFFSRYWQRLIECHPEIDLLVGDEYHLNGGWTGINTASSRAMFGALKHISGFYPMSGSPICGKLDKVFNIIQAIEPLYYGSYNGFLRQHAGFIDDYSRVLYWVNEEKVTTILQNHSVRHTFEQVYGKQARVYETELIEMQPKMKEAYDQFAEMAVLELEESFLEGVNPGVAAIRARQILACPETFGLCEGEVSGKDERLAIHASDHEGVGGLLVFSALVAEVERCAKVMEDAGLRVGIIHGGISADERSNIDEAYRAGELDAIAATTATAGVGYNWSRTKTIIIPSLSYSDDALEQAIRRGERELREHPLRIIQLQYEDSIDQHVEKIVKKKAELTETVMKNV